MEFAPPPSNVETIAPTNGVARVNGARPETLRLRSRLDDVMARLHAKLEDLGEDEAVADQLDPKATRMACAAFKLDDLELENSDDAA